MLTFTSSRLMLLGRVTQVLHKRSGKPNQLPQYKQVYLPYDTPPTRLQLERERRKFAHAYDGRMQHRRLLQVKEIPENMYTYGKQGMSVPISLFKDQADPVIGPQQTYPGIYENKIVCQPWNLHELIEQEKTNTFQSPWLREVLEEQTMEKVSRVNHRLAMLNIKCVDLFQKERGAQKRAAAAAAAATPSTGSGSGSTTSSKASGVASSAGKGKANANANAASAVAAKAASVKAKGKGKS